MAKNEVGYKKIKNISRPGIHSKTKNSNSKTSKNYVKKYAGQGR
jgi:hypothetical protein